MAVLTTVSGQPIADNNGLQTKIVASDIQQPVEIQGRYATTIQTHNAVNILASGSSVSTTWIDCNGFSELAITLLNDAGTNSAIDIQWSNDGTALHGKDYLAGSTPQHKAMSVPIKARYAKVQLWNNDTVAHTMSAWAYLKA